MCLDSVPEYKNIFNQFCQNYKALVKIGCKKERTEMNHFISLLGLKSLNCLNLTIYDADEIDTDALQQLLILNRHETLNEINLKLFVMEIKTIHILIFKNVRALKG